MKIMDEDRRAVEFNPETNELLLINQLLLPHKVEFIQIHNYKEASNAISKMIVRGAPAIGATGAYALALTGNTVSTTSKEAYLEELYNAKSVLISARPTAKDLQSMVERVYRAAFSYDTINEIREALTLEAIKVAEENAEECWLMGEKAYHLIDDGSGVLTHCNAGALATVDHGTALSPIRRAAHEKSFTVFIGRTSPYFQGARLTTWELAQEKIPHVLIDDNAVFHHMFIGDIDLIIVGCDRVAINGDFANKIGTLGRAIAAKYYDIPFYVALPKTTFDECCLNGNEIPLEERRPEEILYVWDGPLIAPKNTVVKNYSFDITPNHLVTGYITKNGIFSAKELKKVLS